MLLCDEGELRRRMTVDTVAGVVRMGCGWDVGCGWDAEGCCSRGSEVVGICCSAAAGLMGCGEAVVGPIDCGDCGAAGPGSVAVWGAGAVQDVSRVSSLK